MEKIIQELNQYLADLCVFYRKLQNYHWNIEGNDFFVIHSKLEEYYNEINEQIDEVAEYILSKNGEPLGTIQDYLNITKIEEAENKKIKSNLILENIIKDYNYLLESVKNIKIEAENIKDCDTSTFVDEKILEYTKRIWMLNQTNK